jgi:hydrogenase maturation protease
MKTLILGLGNRLLSDEGIGLHVLEALSNQPLPIEVCLLDGGTLSFTLAVPIQEHEALIVIDAAQLQAPPGSLRTLVGEEMDQFLLNNRKSSVHEVGLGDLRTIALLTGHWPEKRALVAIQPQSLEWGEQPTPAVAAAIPLACQAVQQLLLGWLGTE